MRGSTQVSKHRSHGTLGPKAQSLSRATQRSTPARPLTRDLAGKYGDPAASHGTRCSVPPNTPGKPGTVTTPGRPFTPG